MTRHARTGGARGRAPAPAPRRGGLPHPRLGNAAAERLVRAALAESGRALDPRLRAGFEERLGASFESVRVHTGDAATRSSAALGARGWAYGDDVVLGGNLVPGSPEADRLLRHELVHVLQQSAGARVGAGPAATSAVEAEAAAAERSGGRAPAVTVATAPAIALAADEQAKGWYDRQVDSAIAWVAEQHRELQGTAMGAARRAISDWPAERRAIAETVLNIAELIADVCFDVVLFVVGANVGVVEGIVDLVVGLLVALEKLVEYMLSWLLQPFDDGRHFREMNEHLIAAVKGLPDALRKAFSDWQQEYLAADPDKKAFMLGRLFGQLVVLLLGAAETGGAAGAAVAGARVAVPAFELATTGARLGGGTISLAALGPPAAAMTALGTASAQVSGEQTVSDLGKEAPKPKPKQERLPEDFAGEKEFEKAWQERTRGEPNEIARKREPGRRADITGKPGEAAGQTVPASLAQKVNNVLGRTLAENSELSRCWEEAKTAVLKNRRPGTPAEALSAYKAAVRPFWERVWDNPGARRLFEDNGFVFPKRGNAPLVQGYEAFPRKLWDEFRVSLDHMAPKATGDNWRFSLDASNLQLRIHADNTMIQNLEVRHPELKR